MYVAQILILEGPEADMDAQQKLRSNPPTCFYLFL